MISAGGRGAGGGWHTCSQQLLGGGDDLGELMDGGSELFLQVADAGRCSAVGSGKLSQARD